MSQPPVDPRSFHVPGPTPAPPPAGPAPRTPEPTPSTPPTRRRRWPWVVVGVLAVAALFPLYTVLSAWSSWRDVERVELSGLLEGASSGTNYLVVGTDSREGIDPDNPNAGVILGAEGERTDTIAVLHVDGDSVGLLAIPRDLYVSVDGSSQRINTAFAFGGPELLVRTVQDELGIGIDHYLEVDFAGFLSLVDALGGVTIDFPHPAHDPKSGLLIPTAGPHTLGGDEALAYVRSRTYTEVIDGVEKVDGTADLGRVQRQQQFLGAVFSELGDTVNPFTLLAALDGVAGNVRVDEGMGLRDALSLGLTLRGADPTTATVPTTPFTTPGGAQVLLLESGSAAEVLAPYR